MKRWLASLCLVLAACSTAPDSPPTSSSNAANSIAVPTPSAPVAALLPTKAPDRVLSGGLTGADSATYKPQTFDVPAGVSRIVVALSQDGDPEASLIELGVADPLGFRGASSKKPFFMIAQTDATPGYLAGRLPAGAWTLTFSVGVLPKDKPTNWAVRIWFLNAGDVLPTPVKGRGPGWYRGDMHLHSGHSDGFCVSQTGAKTPCPLYNTIVSASTRPLDFIMLTEHNAVSQTQVIRELQPAFDRLLIIPGQEVTTFYGHFNVWGVDTPVDYRLVPGERSLNDLADDVHRLGGLLSINHPAAPTGAMCLGCGFSALDVDYTKIDAMEAVNGGIVGMTGGNPEGPLSGIPYWVQQLRAGHSIVAVGGSDTHDGTAGPDAISTIGRPTTVVYADNLDQRSIVKGLKSGRVFIDIARDPSATLDISLSSGGKEALMGGSIASEAAAEVRVDVRAPARSTLEIVDGDKVIASEVLAEPGTAMHEFKIELARGVHPIRAQVRGSDGRLRLLSNAILATRN